MGNIFGKKNPYSVPKPPKSYKTIDRNSLWSLIFKASLNNEDKPSGNILLSDREYCVYPKEELERFLRETSVDTYKYRKEANDCDNFAKMLMGLHAMWTAKSAPAEPAFGLVTGDLRKSEDETEPFYHAMNIAVVTNSNLDFEVLFIEPQNDSYRPPTKNSTYWTILL